MLHAAALRCRAHLQCLERVRLDLPVPLPARDPVAFATNGQAVCWAERGGAVRCWGTRNTMGQLGAVTADMSVRPVAVAEPVDIEEGAIRARARALMGVE